MEATDTLTHPRKTLKEEPKLNSDRYEVLSIAGRGTWGTVFKVRDKITDETLAAKVLSPTALAEAQMKHRNLDITRVLLNEGSFTASSRVVPRRVELDNDQKPFLIMPFYPQSFAQIIGDAGGPRLWLGNGLTQDAVTAYAKDIAEGLAELHSKYRKAHADLKSDNILIGLDGRLSISDLGTATFATLGKSGSPRDRMGFPFTRAPECWKEGYHPKYSADCYSFASIESRVLTGKYLNEDLINNSLNPSKLFEELGEDGIRKLIKKQLTHPNIPKRMYKLLLRCADPSPHARPYNGQELTEELRRALDKDQFWKNIKTSFSKYAIPSGIAASILSLALAGIAITPDPKRLEMPDTKVKGVLYHPEAKDKEEKITFEHENIPDLPEVATEGMIFGGIDKWARRSTDNRTIAYLVKTHGMTNFNVPRSRSFTEYQFRTFIANTNDGERQHMALMVESPYQIWAKAIEVALQHGKTKDGRVDLEDTLVVSRIGPAALLEAQRKAGSQDYVLYRNHLPQDERRFIDTWIAVYHMEQK